LSGLKQMGILCPQYQIAMGMSVNKSRAYNSSVCINYALCFLIALSHDNLAVLNAYTSRISRCSAAVNYLCILNQHIQHLYSPSFPRDPSPFPGGLHPCTFVSKQLLSVI